VLGALDVVVGSLDELEQDVLDVFADVAGFRERRRIRDREGHVEALRQGLRQIGLAASGRTHKQNVALLNLDIVDRVGRADRAVRPDPLVVVVHGDR